MQGSLCERKVYVMLHAPFNCILQQLNLIMISLFYAKIYYHLRLFNPDEFLLFHLFYFVSVSLFFLHVLALSSFPSFTSTLFE